MSRPLKTGSEDMMVLRPQSVTDSDYELDWSYTVRCTKEWSDDELLSHLCSKAFTIPPRDYNPSAPFVYVRTEDGVVTTLPHGYRIPLMFVARYQWETTFRTLSLQNRRHWEADRDELFHLSRLCHVLFSKARAKAESSGMEKGWRCVMFDRLLTRFYKGWPVSSPAKLEAFASHFSSKEYDRDVLKNDWKRWALKGFFRPPSSSPSIHLSEEEVNNGITAVDLIMRLSKVDNVWTLSTNTKNNNMKRRPIKFMQPTEGSSSDLSDCSLSSLDDVDDSDEDEDDENTKFDQHPTSSVETPAKRCREPSEGDDTKNRSGKRAKLEEIIRSISSPPCSPIVLTCSGDVFDEELDLLPKFKVPRQILHSYGWKPRSATDGLAWGPEREEQMEVEVEVGMVTDVPNDASTSILLSSGQDNDTPHQAPPQPVPQPNEPPTSPNLTSISSKSKGKQPESASTSSTTTGHTFRHPRNSVHVSLPSSSRMMKPRTRPPAAAAATTQPLSPKLLSPPMTRGRVGGVGKGTDPSRNDVAIRLPISNDWRWARQSCCDKSTLDSTGAGADGDINMNRKTEKAESKPNAKDVEEKKIARFHSEPLLSSSSPTITTSTNMEDNDDECDEQGATSTAIPVSPELELLASLPEPTHSTSYSISSSSSSLSSLSSSTSVSATPPPSNPLVSNSGNIDVAADVDAGVEYGTQQVKDRIRELKTRFLGFRDDMERIIGRLEVLEGGEDGDLRQGAVDGISSDHPNFVSQVLRKLKDKESDIIGVSESGGVIPGYIDVAIGVNANALVALKDISVQTVDVSSATPLHSADDLTNVTKKNLESKKNESISPPTQFVNTTSNLSAMVDNLVSTKMLSMMQSLVKSSVGGNSNGKAKLVEPSTSTNTESDSDLICRPSPSSSSHSISAASHSIDANDSLMSSLLEELKTMKEEARCREQSEKEDLLAMRQLHSAEVDALRRRLSYLESRNLTMGRWDLNNGGGRWKGSRVDDSLELDRHHYHHRFFEDSGTSPSFRQQQQYGDRSQAFQQNSLAHYSSRSTSIVNPEGASTSTNIATTPLPPLSVTSSTATADSTVSSSTTLLPTPTPPTPTDKHYSFGFSKDDNNHYHSMGMGMDLDDDSMGNLPLSLPLPIKSQRKHHIMSLARTHFS